MGHDNIKIDHIGFETKPDSRKWADEALVDAFLSSEADRSLAHWVDMPGHEWKDLWQLDDLEDYIYEEELQQKVPIDNREIYWTSKGAYHVYFWEGPADSGLHDKIQERFHKFAKANARKVMKKEVADLVKRGMATGLSREDLIELVNEASIEEVMVS